MTIHEVNAITGEAIDREPTAQELAQKELDAESSTAKSIAEAERAQAKTALLERLGITEDEAKLLLS
jgi:hypothetical protein